MKLYADQIRRLTPLEQRLYASIIGETEQRTTRRDIFVSQSLKYVEGDENVLPWPERCSIGIMMFSLCQHLASPTPREAVAFTVRQLEYVEYVKQKLRALGAARAYVLEPEHLAACIYGNGSNPFNFYRDRAAARSVLSLPGLANQKVICALDPPPETVLNTSEYTVKGLYSNGTKELMTPLAKRAAHLGLTEVLEIDNHRLWTYKEEADDDNNE